MLKKYSDLTADQKQVVDAQHPNKDTRDNYLYNFDEPTKYRGRTLTPQGKLEADKAAAVAVSGSYKKFDDLTKEQQELVYKMYTDIPTVPDYLYGWDKSGKFIGRQTQADFDASAKQNKAEAKAAKVEEAAEHKANKK